MEACEAFTQAHIDLYKTGAKGNRKMKNFIVLYSPWLYTL